MPEITGMTGNRTDPYKAKNYRMKPTEQNTLNIESYFKLLGAQLANQDMMNPMDNSEMLNQMTQMAMVQSIAHMTEGLKETQALTRQAHAFGMLGKNASAIIQGAEGQTQTVTGRVERVELGMETPRIKLSGHEELVMLQDIFNIGVEKTAEAGADGETIKDPEAEKETENISEGKGEI